VRRLWPVALAAVALAGCGGGSKSTSTTSSTVARADPAAAMKTLITSHPELAGKVRVLYDSADWAVVQSSGNGKAHAVAFRLDADGSWVADRAGKVKVRILGPQPGTQAPKLPQVAIGITSKLPFVDSGLWVDGKELFEKGGGSATAGTIYGAPAHALAPGTHVAVGYARNIVNATAVAWVFRTP
jgi:hypothetical protein